MYHSLSLRPQGNFKEIAKIVKKTTDPESNKTKYEKTKKALYIIEQDHPFDSPTNRIELKNSEQFFPSAVRQENNHTNRAFLAGGTLSGKSFLANEYAKDYKKKFPKNKVILFSGIENNDYDDIRNLHRIRIDESLLDNPISLEELHDSLTIFDDILAVTDKDIQKELCRIRDKTLSAGRHHGIDCLVLQQNLLDGNNSKSSLNNSFQVVAFPKASSKHQFANYLERYHKMKKDDINHMMHKPTRWILMNNVNPMYRLTEHECELT